MYYTDADNLVNARNYAKLDWHTFAVHTTDANGSCSCGDLNCITVRTPESIR
jgi:hypothetical protein